jgi:hypothetical protein
VDDGRGTVHGERHLGTREEVHDHQRSLAAGGSGDPATVVRSQEPLADQLARDRNAEYLAVHGRIHVLHRGVAIGSRGDEEEPREDRRCREAHRGCGSSP